MITPLSEYKYPVCVFAVGSDVARTAAGRTNWFATVKVLRDTEFAETVVKDTEPPVSTLKEPLTMLARACVSVPLKLALIPVTDVGQIWVYELRLELATNKRRVARM